jgi:signal transduction histidine kinase
MQPILSDFQDQLVRGLTHRMNNILTLFHGYLGLLIEDGKLDPVTREGLNRIREGAHDATELIARANAISGPAPGSRRETGVAAFLRQLAPTFDGLRGPDVRIMVECPEELPRICVDPARLKLGMVELVRNACEAAVSKVTIRVNATEAPEEASSPQNGIPLAEGPWVRIAVIDDGDGIPAKEANRIYEPFFSTKNDTLCAGLGLAVALGCAQQAGGTLRHLSRKGGTTFEILLPSAPAQALSAVA